MDTLSETNSKCELTPHSENWFCPIHPPKSASKTRQKLHTAKSPLKNQNQQQKSNQKNRPAARNIVIFQASWFQRPEKRLVVREGNTHKLFTTKVTNHLKVAAFRCGDASGMQLSQPPNLLPEKQGFFHGVAVVFFFVVFQPITSRVFTKFCPSFLRYFFVWKDEIRSWEVAGTDSQNDSQGGRACAEHRGSAASATTGRDVGWVGKRLNYALFKWHYIMNNYCIQKKISRQHVHLHLIPGVFFLWEMTLHSSQLISQQQKSLVR